MRKLLGIGSKTLTDTFQETIREQSQPVEPLHYITKSRCLLSLILYRWSNESRYSFPHLFRPERRNIAHD